MINIDTRILPKVSSDEFWLLMNIVSRFNKKLICWPSNKTLCKDTRWSLKKLQRVKSQLIDKGLLVANIRYNLNSQTSNEYQINTDLIGVYITADNINVEVYTHESNGLTPPKSSKDMAPESKGSNEVLTIEVLTNDISSTKVDDVTKTVFVTNDVDAPLVLGGKSKKARARKKATETDECYVDFVDAWCKQYPDLGFNAVAGTKIKSMIKHTKDRLKASGKEPTKEAAVAMFQYILAYVKREGHWVHGKPITTFDQHYNSVVREIKEGKQKKPANLPSSSIFGKYGNL